MKLKIDEHTTFARIAPFVDVVENDRKLLDAAWEYLFGCGFWEMTIDDFCDMAEGKCEKFKVLAFEQGELTAFGYVVIRDFKAQAEQLIAIGNRLTIRGEGGADATDTEKLTLFEAMAFFVREFFGLHSFAEAARVSVGDWLLAKKHDYCKRMAEKRAADAMKKRLKTKTR